MRKFIQSERAGLYLSMPPNGQVHEWRCCLRLHFRINVQYRRGFEGRSTSAVVRKRQPRIARIQTSVRSQPPYKRKRRKKRICVSMKKTRQYTGRKRRYRFHFCLSISSIAPLSKKYPAQSASVIFLQFLTQNKTEQPQQKNQGAR